MRLSRFSHFFSEIQHSSIQFVNIFDENPSKPQLFLKRDDLLHPVISGNKWRKLKHLLMHIESQGFKKIVVMGGAYSNLLHSLAYIGYRLNWSVEFMVRGHPEQSLTPMLKDAIRWGAKLTYVDRNRFRQLREKKPQLPEDVFWIPEGGFHELALMGTAESLMEINDHYDYIVMATATGTSLAGLALGAYQRGLNSQIIGISVLNNAKQVNHEIDQLLPSEVPRPGLISGYEFGGYAKSTAELKAFIEGFSSCHEVPLEPVYSGKSFFATVDLLNKGYFADGGRILLIHCGGLQGKRLIGLN